MSMHYVAVPERETVHLRSSAETSSSNVITELPRGWYANVISSLDPFKYVETDDILDKLKGYVHRDYLTNLPLKIADEDLWIPRYSTKSWKRSSHGGKYYLPVKRIQEDLKSIGYTQVGTADGYFGQNTETAVKAFQKDNKLTVDGIFGKNSKQKLWDSIDRRG